jgi:hypothetical protein
MPASPLPRILLPAAAALLATGAAFTGSAVHGSSGRPVDDAQLAAVRAAQAQDAAQDRDRARHLQAKDRAVRADARAAAAAAEAKARAARAAAAKAAKARAEAKAKAAAKAKARAAAERAARSASRASARSAAAAPARTSWPALNRAIAQIPGYRDGIARWHVTSRYGHYGITDANQPGAANIYISPSVPQSRLYSVAAHEYGHAVVIANYGTGYGPYTEYSQDMVSWFGGDKVTGLERAADCIALRLGATWTNYTGCTDPRWKEGARILLAGGKL